MIKLIVSQLLATKELKLECLDALLDYEHLMYQATLSVDDLFVLEDIGDALNKLPEINERIQLVALITNRLNKLAPAGEQTSKPASFKDITLIERLGQVAPARLEAIPLALEFHDSAVEPTPARVVAAQPEFERAIEQLAQHTKGGRRIVKQCLKNLIPAPTRGSPIGF